MRNSMSAKLHVFPAWTRLEGLGAEERKEREVEGLAENREAGRWACHTLHSLPSTCVRFLANSRQLKHVCCKPFRRI